MLFYNLYCGNQVDSTNLISTLENQVRVIYKKDMKKDDYHVLYYILNILHAENNCPINPNFNINSYQMQYIQNMKNDNYMYNLFRNFYQQTTNSIISQYFYNIEKYFTLCFKCDKIFYYDHKIIITFDLDQFILLRNQEFLNNTGSNISLAQCFYYYQKEKSCKCPICQSPMSKEQSKILFSTKVLILRFKRSFHNLKGDVDFDIAFNINNMINSNTNRETMNKKYYLKSIISLYQSNNGFKYFSDVCINGNWYRFCDNNDFNINIKNININELKKFEPQMLIYELEDDNNQFNPFYNSFENKNIMTMMQLINMQLQMLQLKEFMQRVCNNASFSRVDMNVQNNNNNNQNTQNLNLDFLIVPENWNGNGKDSMTIKPQVKLEDTMEKAIDNFYTKLLKPREAIKRFEFNNQIVDPYSKFTLRDFGINNNSIIKAIKADNFDILSIFNNNNNNQNQNYNNNNQSTLNISLIFVIIPENWNGNKKDSMTIKPQVKLEDTIEKAIDNFYTKLLKPREAIKRFMFNNIIVDPHSKLKLREFGINNNSTIFAIKANNFDILSIFNNNNNNQNSQFLSLDFVIIPENWSGDQKDSLKIKPQVTFGDTVEKAINNFYIKLVKPREAIKRFEFNHMNVNVNSKTTLRDFGVQNNSIIYAIKADNFDTLSLFNNNNNNNNNYNNNINNNNNNININNNNFNNLHNLNHKTS